MLTSHEDMRNLDPKKSVNKLCENVYHIRGVFRIFNGWEWHQILTLFKDCFFSAQLITSKLRNKNMALGNSRGMLLRKIFENLDSKIAILVLFEQLLRSAFYSTKQNQGPSQPGARGAPPPLAEFSPPLRKSRFYQ